MTEAAVAGLDALFEAYAGPGAPGAAVAVIRRGEVVLARGYGAARLGGPAPEPVVPETSFRLASITKQLTARLVALLVEEGALSPATPVGEVLPGLPDWGGAVRVGHLVAHTAGLPEYESLVPPGTAAQLTDRDVVRLLAGVDTLRFTPGERFDYSNGGYALLARVAEEVTGRAFGDLLDAGVFRPLGMRRSVAHVEGRTRVWRRAYGYRWAGEWVDADQSTTSAVLGDGGVYSSVLDLARWDAASCVASYRPAPGLLDPYAAPVADGVTYGWGWYRDRFRGHERERHDGWSCGFQNEIQRFPAAGLTVVVLTNRASPAVREIVESIAGRLLAGP